MCFLRRGRYTGDCWLLRSGTQLSAMAAAALLEGMQKIVRESSR